MKYIYLTTNLINNKKYIGQHIGELDDPYLGSGVHFLRAANIFLGLSPNSTYRLRQAINNQKLYHNYYFKDNEPVSTILGSEE